jgi:N-formylglutamate amidohydrolase
LAQRPAVYKIELPAVVTSPVIFSSPHSGCFYPPEFIDTSRLSPLDLRRSEDCYVDQLFGAATTFGATLIKANYPRAFVDVNREAWELDPSMFNGPLPDNINRTSSRVASGLGTIPRLVAESTPIYKHQLAVEEGLDRIRQFYFPYHKALSKLIELRKEEFGHCLLIDCHSMPAPIQKDTSIFGRLGVLTPRPIDFVLGDSFGRSCDFDLVADCHRFLSQLGYNVARNKPYAGGYITKKYGRPARSVNCLQIEINRDLYMNSGNLEPTNDFKTLKHNLGKLISFLATVDDVQRAAE